MTTQDKPIGFKNKKYNNKIIRAIKDFIKENPEFRFIQIMTLLGIVSNLDRYNEESETTYKRLQARLLQIKNMKFRVGIDEHKH